jgi:threonine/homoserine/homoserine lactone efflux protein
MLLWLAWRGWNTPRTDGSALSGQAARAVTHDVARGMIVSVTSPYNLFLMFGLLPTLVAPHELRADHIALLTTAFLLATVVPHVVTIWAGSALHQIWSRQGRLFARAGALLMLGFAGVGILSFA